MVCVLATCLSPFGHRCACAHPAQRERVVVIGSGRTARRIMDLASRHPERRFQVIGVLDDGPGKSFGSDPPVVGRVSRLPALLSRGEVDRVVVALGTADDAAVLRVLRKCDPFGVPVDVLPRFFELIGHRAQRYRIGATPMLTINGHAECVLQRHVKRCFDVAAAATILLVTALPCLVIAVLIKRHDHGPVLFRQRRIVVAAATSTNASTQRGGHTAAALDEHRGGADAVALGLVADGPNAAARPSREPERSTFLGARSAAAVVGGASATTTRSTAS